MSKKYEGVGNAKGERVASARLTAAIVADMRRRHYLERYAIKTLAGEYDVSYSTAYDAIRGVNWRHVPMPKRAAQ